MQQADFFILAGTIIPVLVLADFAAKALDVRVPVRIGTAELLVSHSSGLLRALPVVMMVWWLIYGWAEWVCLRSLETGHVATGGTALVWIALGFLGVQNLADRIDFQPKITGVMPGA